MRLMVLGEQDATQWKPEVGSDGALDPQLLAESETHCAWEALPRARKGAQRTGENSLEFEERFLIKDNRVELRWLQPGALKAPIDGVEGKRGVALAPRKPFLLHREARDAVHDERGGGVMVVGRNSENFHRSVLALEGAGRRARPPAPLLLQGSPFCQQGEGREQHE